MCKWIQVATVATCESFRETKFFCAEKAREDLLVAEYGEALLERELEPVAARDPVPSPVVEVLVRNHSLDSLEVRVRCCQKWRNGVSINAHGAPRSARA